jgi:hypothetical protein
MLVAHLPVSQRSAAAKRSSCSLSGKVFSRRRASLAKSSATLFALSFFFFFCNWLSCAYCGNCLMLVTCSPVKRTKTVFEGGWP